MWAKLLFSAVLFYAFVPGVLLNLSTPFTSPAVTHAIVFALVSGFIWKAAKPMLPKMQEGKTDVFYLQYKYNHG